MVDASEFKEAFDFFDKEKTGQLEAEQLGNIMRSLGQNPTVKEVDELFAKHAKGGKIDPDSLVAAANDFEQANKGKDLQKELAEAFKAYDRDGNGTVAAAEIKAILANLPTVCDEVEVDDIMKEADPQETGQIDYQTFSKMVFAPYTAADYLMPETTRTRTSMMY